MSKPEYRIDFTIQRDALGDGDFVDIGFGSSGAWSSIDQAAHMLTSAVQNGAWETEAGMPEPGAVLDEQRSGRGEEAQDG
jgi:hypothetical protein